MSVAIPVVDYVDPSARRIYLLAGVTEYHPLDDIYAEIRNLRETDESLRKYFVFVQGGGNIPKNVAGTLRTPRYAIFKNCKVVVTEDTYVTGEQLYADENGDIIGKGPDCIDHALSPTDAYLDCEPPGSEVIISGSGVTEQDKSDIAGEVWDSFVSTYQAKVWPLNGEGPDDYLMSWFKNGEPITTGITTATLQVVKAADGTDLISEAAVSEVNGLGVFKYSTTNKMLTDTQYIIILKANIDDASRSWYQPFGFR